MDTNAKFYLTGSTLWLTKGVGIEKTSDAGGFGSGVMKVGNVFSVWKAQRVVDCLVFGSCGRCHAILPSGFMG